MTKKKKKIPDIPLSVTYIFYLGYTFLLKFLNVQSEIEDVQLKWKGNIWNGYFL